MSVLELTTPRPQNTAWDQVSILTARGIGLGAPELKAYVSLLLPTHRPFSLLASLSSFNSSHVSLSEDNPYLTLFRVKEENETVNTMREPQPQSERDGDETEREGEKTP